MREGKDHALVKETRCLSHNTHAVAVIKQVEELCDLIVLCQKINTLISLTNLILMVNRK